MEFTNELQRYQRERARRAAPGHLRRRRRCPAAVAGPAWPRTSPPRRGSVVTARGAWCTPSRGRRSTPTWPGPRRVTMVVQVNGKVQRPDRGGARHHRGGRRALWPWPRERVIERARRGRAVPGRGPAAPAGQHRRLTPPSPGRPRRVGVYDALNPASISWICVVVHAVRGVEADPGDHVPVAVENLGRDLLEGARPRRRRRPCRR